MSESMAKTRCLLKVLIVEAISIAVYIFKDIQSLEQDLCGMIGNSPIANLAGDVWMNKVFEGVHILYELMKLVQHSGGFQGKPKG